MDHSGEESSTLNAEELEKSASKIHTTGGGGGGPDDDDCSSMPVSFHTTKVPLEAVEAHTESPTTIATRSNAGMSDSHEAEEVQALLTAIEIMSRLASLDSSQYTSTMMAIAPSSSSLATNNAFALQSKLDHLQKTWKFEETSIPTLVHHIHRLQSNMSHNNGERNDNDDKQHLQQQQKHIQKLEKALHKLHAKNAKLRSKLQQQKSKRKSIVKHVQDYMTHHHHHHSSTLEEATNEQQEQSLIAQQLRAHERLLRLEHHSFDPRQGGDDGGNRSRCSSRDTVFSDIEALYPMEQFLNDAEYYDDSFEQSSVSSVSTAHSLVTDDGIATVRLHRAGSEDLFPLQNNDDGIDEYQLTFPQGTKIGLQFHKMVVTDKPMNTSTTGSSTRRGLLNDALADPPETAVRDSTADASRDNNSNNKSSNKETSFFDAFLRKAPGGSQSQIGSSWTSDEDHHDAHAFLVCGHYGFDSSINVRPAMGARLIQVNGKSVGDWTLDQIRDATHNTKEETFTMTFRNEPLHPKQKDVLSKAIAAADQQHEMEERGGEETGSCDGEKDGPAKEKRSMFPAFLQLNQHGGEGKRDTAGSGVDREGENGGSGEGDAPKEKSGGRSMLIPFLNINQNSSTSIPRDSTKSAPQTLSQSSGEKSRTVSETPNQERSISISQPEIETGLEHHPEMPLTPPSQKLKKSMKSMGKKFKGWMS